MNLMTTYVIIVTCIFAVTYFVMIILYNAQQAYHVTTVFVVSRNFKPYRVMPYHIMPNGTVLNGGLLERDSTLHCR